MATTISSGTNPYKLGSPPDFGTLYSGRALEFDGVTDKVNFDSILFGSTDTFTISVWMKAGTISADNFVVCGKSDASSANTVWLDVKNQNIIFRNSSGTDHSWSSSINKDLLWHYYVIVANGDDSMNAYYDGASLGTSGESVVSTIEIDELGGSYSGGAHQLNGSLSNFQIWDKAWSESDVQYAYTHPEKLITDNSAVTSGTTISNLKAWYPCTEGNPRSPQTTVYDGSPKELGSDIVEANTADLGSFDTDTTGSWDSSQLSSKNYDASGFMNCISSSDSSEPGVLKTSLLTAGNVYKVTFRAKSDRSVAIASIGNYQDISGAVLNPTLTTSWQNYEFYCSANQTTFRLYMAAGGSVGDYLDLDDIVVKEVQMGNHGTTTFYGDELWDSDRSTFTNGSQELRTGSEIASGVLTHHKWYEITARDGIDFTTYGAPNNSVGTVFCLNHPDGSSVPTMDANDKVFLINLNWVPYSDNTLHIDSNTLKTTYDDDARGSYVFLKDASDTSSDLTVGRTYKVTFDAKVGSGDSVDVKISTLAGSPVTVTETTFTEKSITFTAENEDSTYLGSENMASGEEIWIDNISLKEVGVAAGWTTADAEPLIPQTALMGMSKPMVFNGIDEHVVLDSTLTLAASDGECSVSCWVVIDNIADSTYKHILGGTHPNIFAWGSYYQDKFKLYINGSGWQTSNTTIVVGDLYHIVYTKNNTAYKFYVNGTLDWSATLIATAGDLTKFGHGPNHEYLGGIMNEVSAWNKELSLTEIQELFNDGVALDATTHSASPSTGTDNLIGYWRNEGLGEWEDLSQNTNDGTPTNASDTILLPEGTTSGKDILGFPLTHTNNGWLNLDGNEYVDAGDNDVFTFIDGGFSLECWFRMDATPTANAYLIAKQSVDAAANGDDTEYGVFLGTDKKIIFRVQDDSASAYIGQKIDSALVVGRWYHLVCTHTVGGTASSTCKIYLGETATPTSTTTVADTDNETGTYVAMENVTDGISAIIGARSDATLQFNGSIDEVRIYNRELSAPEITKNYNHGKSKHS